MTTHVSIDLETLGTTPECRILSIGYAIFTLESGVIYLSDEIRLNHELQLTRTIDPLTVDWWSKQSDAAKSMSFSGESPLEYGLKQLRTAINSDMKVWGNGATFDISILEHAYGYKAPWKFYNVRDMRTIIDLAESLTGFDKTKMPFIGVRHSARFDSEHQAKLICAAYKALKENGYAR